MSLSEQSVPPIPIVRRHFSVSEFYRMAEAGVLTEDDRVELIEGEVLEMSPIGSRHAACVNRLNSLFNQQAGQTIMVSVQNPIRLDEYSEPQPDVAVLRQRDDFYAQEHPTPADVLLIIEVADTSIEYDRYVKLPLYARAGIPEVWLVNLTEDLIEMYTDPHESTYRHSQQARRGATVTLPAIPDASFSATQILG